MVVELTSTILKQRDSQLPVPIVQDVDLTFVGRGTGRLFSEPLEPTILENIPYITLDMGVDGIQHLY